jgi:2-polyprenyl-3-methyl-5-hydroxy-6-metoxy-1,4-benzoquinol methylase
MTRKELFEKFDNHYLPETEHEENEYLVYLEDHIIKWSSYPYFKRQIKEYLISKYDRTATVLDIGCGCGTYYYLLKDHFDKIDGIEGDSEIIKEAQLESLYNKVFNVDACDFKFDYYDIITMGDCLEHIEYNKAYELVNNLCKRCKELIIVIPYNLPMEEAPGKPYSSHKQSDLAPDNMENRYPMLKLLFANQYIGVYKKR